MADADPKAEAVRKQYGKRYSTGCRDAARFPLGGTMTPDRFFNELTKNNDALKAVSVNLARQGGALNGTISDTTGRLEKSLGDASGRLADALNAAAAAADKQSAQLATWTKVLAWATIVLTVATAAQAFVAFSAWFNR